MKSVRVASDDNLKICHCYNNCVSFILIWFFCGNRMPARGPAAFTAPHDESCIDFHAKGNSIAGNVGDSAIRKCCDQPAACPIVLLSNCLRVLACPGVSFFSCLVAALFCPAAIPCSRPNWPGCIDAMSMGKVSISIDSWEALQLLFLLLVNSDNSS